MIVNRAKSRTAPLKQYAFLGYQIGYKGKRVWTEKMQHRFKEQVRETSSRNCGHNFTGFFQKLDRLLIHAEHGKV
jgi:hypothetical protein